jgi:hypothetical protein
MIEEVVSLAEFRPKPGVMYHPARTYQRGKKYYVSSDLLRKMLEAQVPIACDCGKMCNFGLRPSEKRGVTAFVSCGKTSGRTTTAAMDGDCEFFGLTAVDNKFMWDFAPDAVKGNWGAGESAASRGYGGGAEKRKRDAREAPIITQGALGTGMSGAAISAPTAAYDSGGDAPRGWDRLKPEEKAVIETMIRGFLLQ